MTSEIFKTKRAALKQLENYDGNKILGNKNITRYFITDNYHTFLNQILNESVKDFYEFISGSQPVSFFLDVEIYGKLSENLSKEKDLVKNAIKLFKDFLENIGHSDLNVQTIVLEAHNQSKASFHVIFNLEKNGVHYLFRDVKILKEIYKVLNLQEIRGSDNKYIFDPSVYREGLFRTYLSSKSGENRPLVKCESLSDPFEPVETFVGYTENYVILDLYLGSVPLPQIEELPVNLEPVNDPEELIDQDRKTIAKFITKEFHHFPNSIREIFVDTTHNCIVVALTQKYCPFEEREHQSNHQYIVIDTVSAKQKCHDPQCNEKRSGEIKLEAYPIEISEIIKRCLKVNQQELDLIDYAIEECKKYITENFDDEVKRVSFDRNEMIFRGNVENRSLVKILKGKCPECDVEHQISDTGYCLKCKVCQSIFPKNQIIPVDNRYKNLNNFWMNYNQLVNNGTINNIINIYNNSGGDDLEFSCDIKLDSRIFRDKEVTQTVNQVLDGHKITMISKLLYTIDKNFVYSRSHWYHFNGSIWKSDSDNIQMKKEIMELSKLFDRIRTHYQNKGENDPSHTLGKNIKSLINKFHKPGFQDDVIKGAKIYFNDESFITNLNSKKHLVPFSNGVFDLLSNQFRETKKEDFINLTVNYNYNLQVDNPEVRLFLEQVLPKKGVRDFVLKKMSECLNGDIPNTNFLMFIGDTGANGKSQLLNLMKATLGELGEKVEVTLLTRKRNNANEANTEKIKLMHKRFAFLSEPEDGEKINIGLLKELTGSEEIVARGLYQESVSFVMEAKLFLACNELPEIKGEDTALWRRIRVIDFPSRFVDDPKEPGEFKIDRTLPSRMREDPSWRQTFMNILLEYYYYDIREPEEVQLKTNEYRQENNDFYNWLDENLEYSSNNNDYIELKTICELYLKKNYSGSRVSSKYKKEIENWIKQKFSNIVDWKYNQLKIKHGDDTFRPRGWSNIKFINN